MTPTKRQRGVHGIDPGALEHELALRNLEWSHLLRTNGGVFASGTVQKLRNRGAVTAETVAALLEFLKAHPVDELLQRLLTSVA